MRGEKVLVFGAAMLLSGLAARAPAHAYQLDTVNLVGCAQEGGVCRIPYPTNVYFGVPGRTNGRPFPQGGTVACNSQTFGDPAPGQAKSCWYAPGSTRAAAQTTTGATMTTVRAAATAATKIATTGAATSIATAAITTIRQPVDPTMTSTGRPGGATATIGTTTDLKTLRAIPGRYSAC